MTQAQLKEYIKKADEVTKQLKLSKTEARKFLVVNGFYTKNGKLRKYYRP
jgi:hypothetical protein